MDDSGVDSGLPFWKYHGAGNDFILLDATGSGIGGGGGNDCLTFDFINRVCDRHLGVGADGLIVVGSGRASDTTNGNDGYDFEMSYYNADGRPGTLCGNGSRCAVVFAGDRGLSAAANGGAWRFLVGGRIHEASVVRRSFEFNEEAEVTIQMPDVCQIKLTTSGDYFVDAGSPHVVRYVRESLTGLDVHTSGRLVRHDQEFREIGGTNVNFVERGPDGALRSRTFERGVEAETLACGSGAVAIALVDIFREVAQSADNSVKPAGKDNDVIVSGSHVTGENCFSSHNSVCLHSKGMKLENHRRLVEARGGKLKVEALCDCDQNGKLVFRNVRLTGPVKRVFRGTLF